MIRRISTGETYCLADHALLAGRIGSADIPLRHPSALPFQAMFAYTSLGWQLFDFSDGQALSVNRRPKRMIELVTDGKFTLAGEGFDVIADPHDPMSNSNNLEIQALSFLADESVNENSKSCHLDLFQGNSLIESATLWQSTIIGSKHHGTEGRFTKLPPVAGLVLKDVDSWVFIRLLQRPNEQGRWLEAKRLTSGDEVQFGDEVRLVFWLSQSDYSEQRTEFIPPEEIAEQSVAELTFKQEADLESMWHERANDSDREHLHDGFLKDISTLRRRGEFAQAVRKLRVQSALYPFAKELRRALRAAQRDKLREQPMAWWNFPGLVIVGLHVIVAQFRTMRAIQKQLWPKALDEAEAGLCHDPNNAGLLMMQAHAFCKLHHYKLALWTLNLISPSDQRYVASLRCKARIHFALGNYERSISFWQRVKSLKPRSFYVDEQIRSAQVQITLNKNRLGDLYVAHIEQSL